MVATLLASKTQFPSRIIQTAENDDNGIALGVLFSECLLLIRNQAVDPSFDLGSSSSYLNVKINLSVRCSTFFLEKQIVEQILQRARQPSKESWESTVCSLLVSTTLMMWAAYPFKLTGYANHHHGFY